MGRIRLLPEHVISQIAAGEVIQRPASVVKELIENSLDAKATKIEIALVDGGLKSLSVRDNGCGMSPEDLRLCVERHATSKILDREDLFRISTFGFRGEALASIRAVSKLTITTREEGAETGYLLHVEGMNPIHLEPVGTIRGTHVEVQDLFFNTPVRRKFLKGANVEFKYILEWVVRFGFAHPQKRFSLDRDGERFLTLEEVRGVEERVGQLWGEEARDHLDFIEAKEEGISFGLYVTSLERARIRPDRCLFFVNKRPIKDKNLQKVITNAFLFAIPKGLYPEAILFLEMDPEGIDVNVHPSKEEIRFYDTSRVFGLIIRAVERHLKRPLYPTELDKGSERAHLLREEPFSYRPQPTPSSEATRGSPSFSRTPLEGKLRIIGQLKRRYILCESEEGLYIFDQHAVHERLMYERLLEVYGQKNKLRQPLLVPYLFELSPEEYHTLCEHLEILGLLGFKISPFGGYSVALQEIPAPLKGLDPKGLMEQILSTIGEWSKPGEELLHPLISKLACHAAIRTGDELSPFEAEALLADILSKEIQKSCPHGRPVFWFISYKELDREFGRC